MSSHSLQPLQCAKCNKKYDFCNRMITLACGHSQCASCTKNNFCCTCMKKSTFIPTVDISTFVCAGCNRHYINHYDKVINQVRILKCGHRRMCNHSNKMCAICSKKAKEMSIDVTLTALVCRVCITDPDLPTKQSGKKKKWGRCCWRRTEKYSNI